MSIELQRLAPYLDNDALALPGHTERSNSCSVRLLAGALGYRRDPDRFRNEFFESLVIDDYADRAAGKYNYVKPDEVPSIMQSAMTVPAGISDDRIKAIAGFCSIKGKNLWVETEKAGRISLARMIRGVVLSSVLEGTDEDPLAIANAIDARTSAAHRPTGK